MTLKEELEILRGEPIKVFTGDPMDIPCIETSDLEKLCKHPVVSVQMITYNHESYIRQAIEGVMMQKTDFEFELIIGEDCSQDKTREICFEYQKKYPDKIRVLWWHENVAKFGGNGRRCAARRRGEFIALCEGDDYWIDPLKLQKQVDIMRKYPNVGLCFTDAQILWMKDARLEDRDSGAFKPGIIPGRKFLLYHLFGADPHVKPGPEGFVMTASVLFRQLDYCEAKTRFEVFNWRLYLGDKTLFYGLSSVSDVYFLEDQTTVYRRAATGIMSAKAAYVFRDSSLLRMYYPMVSLGLKPRHLPNSVYCAFCRYMPETLYGKSIRDIFAVIYGVFLTQFRWRVIFSPMVFWWLGLWTILFERAMKGLIVRSMTRRHSISSRLGRIYQEMNND